jgi:peptidoglycan/xylan/chitin deacetylase (PgdA/CDA1 family)
MRCKLLLIPLMILLVLSGHAQADKLSEDLNFAVVYAYFRVGDDDQDTPGISADDFLAQVTEISSADSGYNVVPLDDILKAQENNAPLPEKTISLTFESTDSSFLRNALPLLKEHSLPFTLFVSPGLLDQSKSNNDPSFLSWDDVRKISESPLATIGMTSYTYAHSTDKPAQDIAADLNHARSRFREELEAEPHYFSYPYGEYTPDFLSALKQQGFTASFGQQSGVISKSSSRVALPRFTMTDDFSDIERFRLTSTSLPFPAKDIQPETTAIGINPPLISFTAADEISTSDLKQIKCFASGITKIDVQRIGQRHFEIRLSNGFDDSKGRLNCTIPAPPIDGSDEPRWRWLGFLFSVPET